MKKRVLCFLIPVLGIAGCQKEDGVVGQSEPVSYFEQSHRPLLGIYGNVKEITEYKQEGENPDTRFFSYMMSFNEQGNLKEYNPMPQDGVSTYWLPVNLERYLYSYDSKGRLSEIRIESFSQTVSYTLIYGAHTDLIPLPIEIKPIGEWFVRGLISVQSNQSDFKYEYDGNRLTFTHSMYGMKQEGFCEFENGYPTLRVSQTKDGDQTVGKTDLKYIFDRTKGVLMRQESVTEEYGEEMITIREYDGNGKCVFVSEKSVTGGSTDYTHKYSSMGWLMDIEAVGDMKNGTHNRSYSIDESKNWIRCDVTTTGYVSWELPEGKEVLIRELKY